MHTGLNDNLGEVEDFPKIAVIDLELHRLQVDMCALQETRLPDTGSIKEDHYTFFWKGKTVDDTREHGGVGFAVKKNSFFP